MGLDWVSIKELYGWEPIKHRLLASNNLSDLEIQTYRKKFWEPDFVWESYVYELRKLNESNELSDTDTRQAIEGLMSLKEILGEDFLRDGFEKAHPLVGEILIAPPKTLARIFGELGNNLRVLQKLDGFNRVKRDLLDSNGFLGAEAEVEIMGKLKRHGKEIEILDNGKLFVPIPDFKVMLLNRSVFFEVSTLREAQVSQKSTDMNRKLSRIKYTNSKGESFSIRINVTRLSPDEVQERFKTIETNISEIIEKYDRREGYIEEKIGVKLWKSENGFVYPTGPSYRMDDIARLFQKIYEKEKKFMGKQPGILWIPANDFDFQSDDGLKQISRKLLSRFSSESKFPEILAEAVGIVTLERLPEVNLPTVELDPPDHKDVFFSQKILYGDESQESVLLIRNPKSSLSDSEISELIQCL